MKLETIPQRQRREHSVKYYRCKCGKHESWASMSPHPCYGCQDCGTNLTEHPDDHRSPVPHDWMQTMVETDEGLKPLTVCRYCHQTRREVEAVGQEKREEW